VDRRHRGLAQWLKILVPRYGCGVLGRPVTDEYVEGAGHEDGETSEVVLGGTALSAALLGALALLERPSLGVAAALLVAVCFFCAFGTVIVAHGRTLFPDRLAGRGVTTVPALVGYIVEAFGSSDLGYRMAFGALAIGLLLGASVYPLARQRYCVACLR
jgi:hypothetical protein